MKKKLLQSIILCALWAAAFQIANAQTTSFTYQGSLTHNGAPANGNFDITIALFEAATGGTEIASVGVGNLPVINGIFSLTMGFPNGFPGAQRFLEIRVRQTGTAGQPTVLSPRQPVNSAPYAIRSLDAAQLNGIDASQYLLSGTSIINAATQYNIDGDRVLSVSGNANTFTGVNAGNSNAGTFNSFFGENAGALNTSGNFNNFFGASAGLRNSTGSANNFFGSGAGQDNTTGSRNSFFGNGAGTANTIGQFNSFFGNEAGRDNTFGEFNSFFGTNAGAKNTSGVNNSFFGSSAGSSNSGGAFNAFFGNAAGFRNTTGGSNSFFGNSAGSSNTSGDSNSAFGDGAGRSNTIGNANSYFGTSSNSSDGLFNATAIGFRAFVGQSNSIVLGGINGINGATADTNVGIGTTTPTTRLDVKGAPSQIRFGDTVTDEGGYLTSTVSSQAVLSGGAKWNGSNFVARSPSSSAINMFSGAIRFFNDTGLTIGATFSPTEVMRLSASGNLGIGTTSPADRLDVNGLIRVSTLGAAGSTQLCRNASNQISTCSSSMRYKSNVNPFSSGLSLIKSLRPVSFDWKAGGARDLGLVAEEVAEVEPLLVTKNEKGETEGVKYDRVGVVLINAVQEQQTQIEAQQKQIDGQNETIKRQQAEIEALKLKVSEIEALKKIVCSQDREADVCRPRN